MKIAIPKNLTEIKHHLRDPLFRNLYFLMANRITGAGAGFIFWLIVARCYTPHEVGLANAMISAMNLLVLFSALGFGFGTIAYLPNEKVVDYKILNKKRIRCNEEYFLRRRL